MNPSAVVALVGRPNAGKSSLFNAITGGHAKVGNFPGVTVELLAAEVKLSSNEHLELIDLPGVYSVEGEADPWSDEGHARRFLERSRPQPLVIAQVLDATQLELSLRLTLELRRLGVPMVVLATQHDALVKQGSTRPRCRKRSGCRCWPSAPASPACGRRSPSCSATRGVRGASR